MKKCVLIFLLSVLPLAMASAASSNSTSGSKLPKAGDFVELGGDDSAADSGKDTRQESGKQSKESGKSTTEKNGTVAESASSKEVRLTGTVRVMRKITLTEAFFKDLPDSYLIPSGRNYSSIYKAFTESQKTGAAVSFKADPKSRRVISIDDGTSGKENSSSDSSESEGRSGSK